MTTAHPDTVRINPYVGPRSFHPTEARQFFGRDRDARALFETLIAERIVLLHSPSGAGKTSLIRAKLMPMMREEGFHVYELIRVNEVPPSGFTFQARNRYVRSVMTSLATNRKASLRMPLSLGSHSFATPTLAGYLAELRPVPVGDSRDRSQSGGPDTREFVPELLIFDQFEEILTLDAIDHDAKLEFFHQLGAALTLRHRWALFSMREEYVAALEPYLSLLPSSLGTRHRLDLLTEKAATDAIVMPAALDSARGSYTPVALKRLLTNLRTITAVGSDAPRLDRLIEPVHLQVACSTVWAGAMKTVRSDSDVLVIEETHVDKVGDVDGALRAYYAESVAAAAKAGDIPEAKVRRWIGVELITSGIRTQVLKGTEGARGINSAAATVLEDKYIIRIENRRSAVWYELAHDRLIEPVRKDNREWFFARGQGDLHRTAEIWSRNGRPPGGLLQGEALVRAKELIAQNPDSETPELAAFIKASDAFAASARTMWGIAALFVIGLLAYGMYHESRDKKEQALEVVRMTATVESLRVWKDSATKVTGAAREAAWRLPLAEQRGSRLMQSIRADSTIRTITGQTALAVAADTILYYVKPSDPQAAPPALVALGFPVVTRRAQDATLETNAIGYGAATNIENRRLLALALVRAGIQLKRICPPIRGTGGPHTLQVFGAAAAREFPTITLAQINGIVAGSPTLNCGLPGF